MSLANFKLLTH